MNAPARKHYGWLWLLVALQVAIPASYYVRADKDDERFAWRMFSAVRVKRCQVKLSERGTGSWQSIDLEKVVHASWRTALARGRARVIDRLLELRCHNAHVREVELSRSCKTSDGRRLDTERFTRTCSEAP